MSQPEEVQAVPAKNKPAEKMSKDMNLVWVDMEMSGLDPEKERILEVALIVTDPELNVIAEAPVYAIHQSDELLNRMDAWNKGTHGKSGLIDRVKTSHVTEEMAEAALIKFLRPYVNKGKSPLCGNTIGQDRRFMVKYMPKLEAFLHYRNIDVSTLKELARRWRPELIEGFKKAQKHTALADILESVEELKYYRKHFLKE
ncbi:MAG: oligoribonuclease [Oxalobacter sp.]